MSYIDKLSILGVRSFDNRASQIIEFYSPLTLIVGSNGTGKTTIIECLKYAATGELPPNSDRGKFFVHDPSLCGESEVLAQVRMYFQSTSDARMAVARSLKLTVKNTKNGLMRNSRTLDSHLVTLKDGQRHSISSGVVDLNTLMPKHLGVPPAVLEYVIFCHQEDTLWPMSEPAILKKRFGEIFEAAKHDQVIFEIRRLESAAKRDLYGFEVSRDHAKKDKERGKQKKKRMQDTRREIVKLDARIADLTRRDLDARNRSRLAVEKAAKLQAIVSKLEAKRTEQAGIEKSIQGLQRYMHDMMIDTDEELRQYMHKMTVATDEGLQEHLDRYEVRVREYEQNLQPMVQRSTEIDRKIQTIGASIERKQVELGTHQANKTAYDDRVKKRANLVKEAATRYGIRGFESEIDDEHVHSFMHCIEQLAREKERQSGRARMWKQEAVQRMNEELGQVGQKRASLEADKNNHEEQLAANEQKLSELQAKINKVDAHGDRKETLESLLKDVTRRLDEAKKENAVRAWDKKLREANAERRHLEGRKEILGAEMADALPKIKYSAQMDIVRQQLCDRQSKLADYVNTHGPRISEVVGSTCDPVTLKSTFDDTVRQSSNRLREAESQLESTRLSLEQVSSRLTTTKHELEKKRGELVDCKTRVTAESSDDTSLDGFPRTLEASMDDLTVARDNAARCRGMEEMYKKGMEESRSHGQCYLCHRRFEKSDEIGDFQDWLSTKIQQATTQSQSYEQTYQSELDKMLEMQPFYYAWKRLVERDIPELEAACGRLESQRDELLKASRGYEQGLFDQREAKEKVESLASTVDTIVQMHKDMCVWEEERRGLAARLEQAGVYRSADEIQTDIKQTDELIKRVDRTLTDTRSQKDRVREQITRLEFKVRDYTSEIASAENALKEKHELSAQAEDLMTRIRTHRESVRRMDQMLQDLAPMEEQTRAQYEPAVQKATRQEDELRSAHQSIKDTLRDLQSATKQIVEYLGSGGITSLEQTRHELASLQDHVRQLKIEQTQVLDEIKTIEDRLRGHTNIKRTIKGTLKYRSEMKKLDAVRAEVAELEVHDAGSEKKRYDREAAEWQETLSKLHGERARLEGQVQIMKVSLEEQRVDWDADYKTAAKDYAKVCYRIEATQKILRDLPKARSSVERAIVRYHSIKLREINSIIEELWKNTYQGTDVDTIIIRSESDTSSRTHGYSYRVVMLKAGVELDMRSRCSAGQKILASIIIRLALAESFGVRCGLIALDEPTTNLDRDNIRALAESLAGIIRIRRGQSNFQLIVITHDVEFLQYMQCNEFTDYYHRIARDERQMSVIERRSIVEVF